MDVFRKPATAEWYYDSAQCVDSLVLDNGQWSGSRYITFDATKYKEGDRHTTMRIKLSEKEIEDLYAGLIKGRKQQLRKLTSENAKLEKELEMTAKEISKAIKQLQDQCYKTDAGSDDEKQLEKVKIPLEKHLEEHLYGRGY